MHTHTHTHSLARWQMLEKLPIKFQTKIVEFKSNRNKTDQSRCQSNAATVDMCVQHKRNAVCFDCALVFGVQGDTTKHETKL